MKIFITREIPEIAIEMLIKNGFEVDVFSKKRSIKKDEIIKLAKESDGLITLLSDKIDKDVIDALPNCKVIANYAVGYNNIDVKYAKQKKIIVTNTPDVLTHSTADLAVSLVMACARNIIAGEKMVRENKFKGWAPKLLLGVELFGKTVGIIGAGRIGIETAKRLKAFGTEIIYYSKSKKREFEEQIGAKKVKLDELLLNSDIISLHIPLTDETNNLLNKEKLQLLKNSAILINTARGEVIDEEFLIEMLRSKKIYAAGFDVYQNEPQINKELLKLENVVLLPHLGSATFEARNKMAELAANNVIGVLLHKKAITPVK
ncbi:MAG TPA: D-glycerate dehydrogenase [Melioribacteraceae bacterium]|mgnify:CR=1 FL=1|nr:D-glycerate dehydrogenase [Melioribacteraceae bacterium]